MTTTSSGVCFPRGMEMCLEGSELHLILTPARSSPTLQGHHHPGPCPLGFTGTAWDLVEGWWGVFPSHVQHRAGGKHLTNK